MFSPRPPDPVLDAPCRSWQQGGSLMCGIVAYLGDKEAQPLLLEGLRRLEYRGYDSSGIAILNGTGLGMMKKVGRIQQLERGLSDHPLHGSLGISHTRWATHGKASDTNAHPHTDASGKL